MFFFFVQCFQEPGLGIRSQTVVLRRSSDLEKQDSAEAGGKHKQEEQRMSDTRSKTVLLKKSVKKDQQENKLEVKDSSSKPFDSGSR